MAHKKLTLKHKNFSKLKEYNCISYYQSIDNTILE